MNKPVIGLCGGIGSGKSTVARILASHGAHVIDSDADSRKLLDSPDVLATIKDWWGPQVVGSNGCADRQAIASIVFSDTQQRQRLEGVLHPLVNQERLRQMADANRNDQFKAIVIDSPLLYEAGLDQCCDCVIFVDVPEQIRLARVTASRGWTAEELARREAAQWSLDRKRSRADFVCENDADEEQLNCRVKQVFEAIMSDARGTADRARP